ncbi:MAG: M1 family metallopeptidase [Ignavibacteriaceae bacterium]
MKILNLFILIQFTAIFNINYSVFPQDGSFMPLNIKNAYKNETRSTSGLPGKNYWQNSSDYNIKVQIIPSEYILKGIEKIKYSNNSPDTLWNLVIRLYQNFNKIGGSRNQNLDSGAITKGDIIEYLSINNKKLDPEDVNRIEIRGTNMFVNLTKPVLPGSKTELEIRWHFQIPKYPNPRMGAYDSTSYFIAYWYPQISVYDDIDGWDIFEYVGEQEFYNDFNSYDVEITVPNNIAVWSTGTLQNPAEVLTEKYLSRYKQALSSDDVIHIISAEDLQNNNIFNSEDETNSWHYKADNIPDFAFALSDHYLWDGVSLVADKNSNKRIYIASAFRAASMDFYNVADITRKALDYYSNELPGVPFPYPGMTVYNGAGGMEFPMMVNDESTTDFISTVGLTTHELAHTYFPFYMGINERKYAWMDEGMARFLSFDLIQKLANYDRLSVSVERYEGFSGNELEMPPITPSVLLRGDAYRVASYDRPGIAYYYLQEVLGKGKFIKALNEYIQTWNGRHPIPFDFFNTFNNFTHENLNWYWEPWFFNKGYPDLAIENAEQKDGIIKIIIENKGTMPLPVKLVLKGENDFERIIYRSPSIWSRGRNKIIFVEEENNKIIDVKLGDSKIPDVNKKDNTYYLVQ